MARLCWNTLLNHSHRAHSWGRVFSFNLQSPHPRPPSWTITVAIASDQMLQRISIVLDEGETWGQIDPIAFWFYISVPNILAKIESLYESLPAPQEYKLGISSHVSPPWAH